MPARSRRLAFLVGTTLPWLFASAPGWAQLGPLPSLAPSSLNQPNGPAQLDASGTASALKIIPNGSTVQRPLSAIAADQVNVKNFGAVGDAQSVAMNATIAAGSTALTVSKAVFASTDVGKSIDVPGAGAAGKALTGVTIAGYVSATAVTLSAPATTALSASAQTILWGTDDSTALAAAMAVANTRLAAGGMACLYAPAASYMIGARTPIPAFATGKAGCVAGDGPIQSRFMLSASFAGDLFAWSEAWIGAGNTPGARATNFAIYGSLAALGQQNGLMFYDREDQVMVADVDIWNLPGRAIYSGVLKNTVQSYMRESHMRGLRIFNSGTPTLAAVEFSTEGGAGTDGTNEISISQIDIYGSPGRAMVIRNNSPGAVRNFKIDALRMEGLNLNTTNVGDLLTIGDPVMTGQVANLQITNLEALWVPTSSAAIHFQAAAYASMPYNVWISGMIGTGPGGGVQVDAGRSLRFSLSGIATTSTAFAVGPNTMVGSNIEIDANGAERFWSYNIDPTSVSNVVTVARAVGVSATPSYVPCVNASLLPVGVGANAVDLQCLRAGTIYTASGPQAVVGGGESNKATNTDTIVTGGANNTAQGYRSAVLAGAFNLAFGQYSVATGLGSQADGNGSYADGNGASARGTNYKRVYAGGSFAAVGDAQTGFVLLRAATASTAATRMTSDGLVPGTGTASNVVNIPAGTAYHLRFSATCRDTTNTAWAIWNIADGALVRPTTGAVTYSGAFTTATTPNQSSGAGSTATLILAADTTNFGLSASVTMPNTDAWHCVGKAETPEEVQ
jgi:hypothetical protein